MRGGRRSTTVRGPAPLPAADDVRGLWEPAGPDLNTASFGLSPRPAWEALQALPPGDSAIVSAHVPGAEEKLARTGILAAVRDGALRASFHHYKTDEDVQAALAALLDSAR